MNEPTNVDEVEKKVWLVQYRITNGVDRDYVRELLGEPSVKQQTVWRYDISPIEAYRYDNMSNIDIEGLEKGHIQAQLFTHWSSEGQIEKIELWHTKDGRIFTYYLYPNGSTAGAIYE